MTRSVWIQTFTRFKKETSKIRMENNDQLLNEIAEQVGEKIEEKDYVVVDSGDAKEHIDIAASKANKFAYSDDQDVPLPGESIAPYLDNVKEINKEDAINSLVQQSALLKVQKEAEEREKAPKQFKLTKEQKVQQKKQIVAYILNQYEEAYYMEHHYIMDGRTRRATRAMIEKDYDKGKYRPSNSSVNLNK